ncbi:MAG: hypothetical protein WC644_10815 [Ignavibacteria bacterium]
MANITNELTGRASGKVGNLVYRITNGVTSLCSAPLKQKPATDPLVIARRNKFRTALRLASSINRIAALKYLWKNTAVFGVKTTLSAFSRIIKKNYPYVSEYGLTDGVYLGPAFGFGITTTDISLSDSAIEVSIDPIGTQENIDTNVEKFISLACVLFVSDPNDTNLPVYDFFQGMSSNVVLNLANPLSFSIAINGDVQEMYNSYETRKAFLILITTDNSGSPVHYSQTFVSL